jgi:pyruvate formate lyase activating enzyme
MAADPQGIIFDIKKYALHDGPGIRTTVFLKGCHLACAWCHNPEGLGAAPEVVYRPDRCLGCGACVDRCERAALTLTAGGIVCDDASCVDCGCCALVCPALARESAGRSLRASVVVAKVLKDQLFYDESGGGVTFSGGEPLLQPEFLLALLKGCGRHELHRCVDTSGCVPWETLSAAARHTDLFLYDLKHMDAEAHMRATGVGIDRIHKNLRRLDDMGAAIIIRLPLIPGFNDDDTNIAQLCDFITPLTGVEKVHLLPYHDFQVAKYERFGRTYNGHAFTDAPTRPVTAVADQIRDAGLAVEIGG